MAKKLLQSDFVSLIMPGVFNPTAAMPPDFYTRKSK